MPVRLTICVFTAVSLFTGILIAAQSDPLAGTWKLDVAKSKYSSNHPKPKEMSLTVADNGNNQVFTLNGTAANGAPIAGEITAPLNGGPVDLTHAPMPNNGYDSAVMKKISPKAMDIVYSKDGKEVATRHLRLSADGQTLTARYNGPDSQGQTVTQDDFWRKE